MVSYAVVERTVRYRCLRCGARSTHRIRLCEESREQPMQRCGARTCAGNSVCCNQPTIFQTVWVRTRILPRDTQRTGHVRERIQES